MSAVRKELKDTRLEFEKMRQEMRKTSARVEDISNQVFILQDQVDSNHIEIRKRPGASISHFGETDGVPPENPSHRNPAGADQETAMDGNTRGDAQYQAADEVDDYESHDTTTVPRRLRVVKVRPEHDDYEEYEVEGTRESIRLDERNLGGSAVSDLPTDVPIRDPGRIPPGPSPSVRRRSPAARPIQEYRAAYALYLEGKWAEAQERFERFARAYPNHDYADNAVFWVGQCQYHRKQFQEAAATYRKVLRRYPRGNKAPDALVKLGMTYWKLGRHNEARSILVQVMEIYPDTRVARLAASVLKQLR